VSERRPLSEPAAEPPERGVGPFVSSRRDLLVAAGILLVAALLCLFFVRSGAEHPAVTEPWAETLRLGKDVLLVVLCALPVLLWLSSAVRLLDRRAGSPAREALCCAWVGVPPAALVWAWVADSGLPDLLGDAVGGFLLVSEPTAAAGFVFALACLLTLGSRLANEARRRRWAEGRSEPGAFQRSAEIPIERE